MPDVPKSRTTSIYEHVLAHLDPSGRGMLHGAYDLPDEERRESGIVFAPGMLDGIALHHMRSSEGEEDVVAQLAQRIADEAETMLGQAGDASLEGLVVEHFNVRTVDAVLDAVFNLRPRRVGVRRVGERLATRSHKREAVKLGIALIGLAGEDVHRDVLLTLGRHEEFTLYAAVAIRRTVPPDDADAVLMMLCEAVEGWGKVNLIERLVRSDDASVRAWLLRGAVGGDLLASMYTSLLIAEAAGLASALAPTEIDEALFAGATQILAGLFDLGGPAGDITDYADAESVVDRWLRHAAQRPPDLRTWSLIESITRFATDSDWASASSFVDRCSALQDRAAWIPLITAALPDATDGSLGAAVAAARHHGLDPFDAVWARMQAEPRRSWYWHLTIPDVTAARLPAYLDLVRATLADGYVRPGGDASERPFGDWMDFESILGEALQVLARFPGEGVDLVETALNAYVPYLRLRGLEVLRSWGRPAIPADTMTLVREAKARETNDDVLEAFESL